MTETSLSSVNTLFFAHPKGDANAAVESIDLTMNQVGMQLRSLIDIMEYVGETPGGKEQVRAMIDSTAALLVTLEPKLMELYDALRPTGGFFPAEARRAA